MIPADVALVCGDWHINSGWRGIDVGCALAPDNPAWICERRPADDYRFCQKHWCAAKPCLMQREGSMVARPANHISTYRIEQHSGAVGCAPALAPCGRRKKVKYQPASASRKSNMSNSRRRAPACTFAWEIILALRKESIVAWHFDNDTRHIKYLVFMWKNVYIGMYARRL